MEQWKDIPGYEGLYQASTHGRIRTCEGKTTSSKRFEKRVWKQRIMKQKCYKSSKGRTDFRVDLWKGNSHRTWLVSRLIALTWCDGYKEGFTVNHIDGNYLNNHSDNLEWISLKENIQHGFKTGLFHCQRPCILIDENGTKTSFMSQALASRSIGRTSSYITNCISKNRTILSIDGTRYTII